MKVLPLDLSSSNSNVSEINRDPTFRPPGRLIFSGNGF